MHRYYGEICTPVCSGVAGGGRCGPLCAGTNYDFHPKARLSELPKTRFFKLEVEPAPPISTV